MTTAITPTRYAIELRDKDGNFKDRLDPYAVNVSWEWSRMGGCGRCAFDIEGDYNRLAVRSKDDVRIYLSPGVLWYRGYVEDAAPKLSAGQSSIHVSCNGYWGLLDQRIVQDGGLEKVYSSTEISAIVSDLVTTFLAASSDVTLGTVDASAFTPDTISFKSTVKEAIQTCADLLGNIECGVDANLQFFWRNQNEAMTRKWIVGADDLDMIDDRTDFRQIINKVFFEGGKVDDAAFVVNAESLSSQRKYGRSDALLQNGSITTIMVANQYVSATIRQKGKPQRQLKVKRSHYPERLEATLPIGAIAVVDPEIAQTSAIYGTTANGGSNKIYGNAAQGGSGQLYGGVRRDQVDRIKYSLSPEDGYVDIDVQFGDSLAESLASAALKQLDTISEATRRRTL